MNETSAPARSVAHPLVYIGLGVLALSRLAAGVFDLSGPGIQFVGVAALIVMAVGGAITFRRYLNRKRGSGTQAV